MEKQITFGEIEYQSLHKKTQKEIFLGKMKEVVPLKAWCDIIRPFTKKRKWHPIELEVILKMYLVSTIFPLQPAICGRHTAARLTQ